MAASIIGYLLVFCAVSQLVQSATTPPNPTTSDGEGEPVAMAIAGGTDSQRNQWPWQVLIRFKDIEGRDDRCGGSIISEQWVMTAAHCIADKNSHVIYGCKYRLKEEIHQREFGIAKFYIHPEYNPFNDDKTKANLHDIALLKLDKTIQFAHCMKAAHLPNTTVSQGTLCTATGWGYDENGDLPLTAPLRQVDIYINRPRKCGLFFDDTGRFCAGRAGKGICKGDSGGPLVCSENGVYYQQGVISVTIGECGAGPQAYIRVCCYLRWIKKITGVTPNAHTREKQATVMSVGCNCNNGVYGGLSSAVTLGLVFGAFSGVVLIVLVSGLICHMSHDQGDTEEQVPAP